MRHAQCPELLCSVLLLFTAMILTRSLQPSWDNNENICGVSEYVCVISNP